MGNIVGLNHEKKVHFWITKNTKNEQNQDITFLSFLLGFRLVKKIVEEQKKRLWKFPQ